MGETGGPAFEFGRDEYEQWYNKSRFSLFEPALRTVERLIDQWLTMKLSDADREKFRISATRVKGMNSLWSKIQKPKYSARIRTLKEIPEAVDDIVGLRVKCNNTCDLELLRNIMTDLPSDLSSATWITLQSNSEKLYFQSPKSSGYRAYHVNVQTLIHTPGDWEPVTVEIQARTLLQDGWGELTHEDTYKPGVQLPALATTLARRMADLLATVDDIAQDLRDELDRLAEVSIASPSPIISGSSKSANQEIRLSNATTVSNSAADEALVSEARNVASRLSKPAALASIAQNIQASFDRGDAKNWGSFGSLASLLQAAVPEYEINYDPPGYLIPPGTSLESESNDAPTLVHRLKWRDKFAPAVSSDQLGHMIESISRALNRNNLDILGIHDTPVDTRFHNAIVKAARDYCELKGTTVSRSRLNYLSNSLRMSGKLSPDMAPSEVAEALNSSLLGRATLLGMLRDDESEKRELREWTERALESIAPADPD